MPRKTKIKVVYKMPQRLKNATWQVEWGVPPTKAGIVFAINAFKAKLNVLPQVVYVERRVLAENFDVWMWHPSVKEHQ